jgi:prevent-host-death family protein
MTGEGVNGMPTIRPSSDLKNSYNELSEICHRYHQPVYITKNGKGDLAVMSIEAYEKLVGRLELYALIEEGLEDMQAGRGKPLDTVFAELRDRYGYEKLL